MEQTDSRVGPNGGSVSAHPNGAADPLAAPPLDPSRPSRRHRRSSSEELGRSYEQMPGVYNFPPTQIAYPNMPPKNDAVPLSKPGHQRVSSWSNQQFYPGPQGHPAYPLSPHVSPALPPYSPSGSPFVPQLIDPNQNAAFQLPPSSQAHYDSSRRKRKNHRKSYSYSGSNSAYGAAEFFVPPPPSGPPPPIPSGRTRRDFSPRSEIMKLTGSLRPSSVPASPVRSAIRPSGSFAKAEEARVTFSPMTPLTLGQSENGRMKIYGTDPSSPVPTVPFLGPSMLSSSNRTNSDSGAGEAVFLAQKKGKHRKSPSTRKMHMRQRSAQLFMEDVKGVEQLPACRDIIFLLLFVFHLLGIIYLGNTYGYEALRYHDEMDSDSSVTIIYTNVVYISCLSGIFSVAVSALALLLMTMVAKSIVQIALILTITLSFTWGTIGIGLSPKKVVPATGVIALALSVAYTFIVWDRIPFAAANLNTAFNGIRANPGAVVIAFFFQFLALGWSIYYTYVVVGVYDAMEIGEIDVSSKDMKVIVYGCLAISYYWTLHVFLNIVQVTVAGVIGSWWFTQDGDTSTRRSDLNRAFFRSSFYAIGSICYGSLLVGPVRLLRQLSVLFRPSGEVSSLMCLHECMHCVGSCLTSCVDNLSDRYNPWAFTYVGLYGYGLVDAGLNATELFDKRGWTTIVSDDLVPNVLLLTSLVIGGITGLFAHLIEHIETLSLTSIDEPNTTSFGMGVLIGLVVSSVLFGIISSSVNAVIVCFAASPVDFEQNHPKLSSDMRDAWREVWPGCMDVVDMRMAVSAYLDPSCSLGEHQPLLV